MVRFGEKGLRVEDAALDLIIEYTGGHPYDTMQAAFEAYLLARRARVLDGRLAGAACVAAQERLATVFEAEVDAFGGRARSVLGRLAKGDAVYQGTASRGSVARALADLQRSGVIQHSGRGRYEFGEPMLARHLRGEGGG